MNELTSPPETTGETAANDREAVLRVVGGSKIYGGVHAIEGVDFDLFPGEVHALVGENGAGKSTLCKAIAGAIRLTSGDIYVDGKLVDFEQPRDALAAGICMVYQETSLVPTMTAAQNIELGNEKLLDAVPHAEHPGAAAAAISEFPRRPGNASGPARHRQEADGRDRARDLQQGAHHHLRRADGEPHAGRDRPLLPSGARPARPRGRDHLHLACAGGIAYRSPTASRCLRDGRLVITAPAKSLNRDALVQHMVGRQIAQAVYERSGKQVNHRREKVLTVENVTMGMVVKNMSFSVYAGEVVGIAGLIGSGRTEIAKIIFGALKRNLVNGGTIRLRGKPIRYRVPRQAIDDGIAYITEDRKANGFFETMIVDDNVYIGKLATRIGFSYLLSRARRSKLANYWVERLKINALQRKARIVELSGGNQQKVVLAKSLVQDPSIVIFDEPTRGVDVGTIPHIHAEIRRLADEGKAIVVISSYLPEILAVSDRILVARTGRIVAEFDAANATQDKILYAAVH